MIDESDYFEPAYGHNHDSEQSRAAYMASVCRYMTWGVLLSGMAILTLAYSQILKIALYASTDLTFIRLDMDHRA